MHDRSTLFGWERKKSRGGRQGEKGRTGLQRSREAQEGLQGEERLERMKLESGAWAPRTIYTSDGTFDRRKNEKISTGRQKVRETICTTINVMSLKSIAEEDLAQAKVGRGKSAIKLRTPSARRSPAGRQQDSLQQKKRTPN